MIEIVAQRLIDAGRWINSGQKCKPGRSRQMNKDDPMASVEEMSLSELTALEAEVIQVAAGAIALEEPNAISVETEKRMPAFKREMSSH